MNMAGNPLSLMESRMAEREQLAEGKWAGLVSEGDQEIANPVIRANTARVLENAAQWMSGIEETVRALNVGNFDRFAFPLIRAVFPNLIAQEIVSVQPMDGPVGLIFFFDLIYGTNKGSIQAGQPVFSSLTGHPGNDSYASPEVREEALGVGNGVAAQFPGTLDFTPILRGSLSVTDGSQVAQDDGNGALIGDVDPAGVNTIDYITGAIDVTLAAAPATGDQITMNYEFDNEANSQVPEIDFQLTSAPVTAKVWKLRTRYSLEAAQNLRSLHGLSAETELVVGLAQDLRFEIDRTIIREVNSFAQADAVSWPLTPPAGVSFTEHKLSFIDVLIRGSNNIFQLVRRGNPNWCVCGLRVSDVIESLPGFKPSAQMAAPVGVVYAGDLNGRWRIFKDPYNIDNSADQRNFLLGYKGSTFLETGYVYAPYIPFYTTPTVILDDFIGRKGMATQWGKRKVNGRFYARGTLTGNFAP